MKRLEFLRLCTLAGMAGGTGIAAAASSQVPHDLGEALQKAGIGQWTVLEDGEMLRISGRVADFSKLGDKAHRLGDGKVRAQGNTLSFERQGRRMSLELLS